MTRAEKRQLVIRLISENPTATNNAISKLAGVDHKTVGVIRASLGNSQPAEIPNSQSEMNSQSETPNLGNSQIPNQPEIPNPGNSQIPSIGNSQFTPEEWFAQAPEEEIARLMMTLPQEKRSKIQLHTRRIQYRKNGSEQHGRAVRLAIEPWKRRTTDGQRAG